MADETPPATPAPAASDEAIPDTITADPTASATEPVLDTSAVDHAAIDELLKQASFEDPSAVAAPADAAAICAGAAAARALGADAGDRSDSAAHRCNLHGRGPGQPAGAIRAVGAKAG